MRVDNPTVRPEDLYTHAAWLHRLAARLVESTAAAEDLVQDTFVAALKSPPERDRPPRPWLAQVLRNLVRNRARGTGRWAARAPRVAAEAATHLPSAEELLTQHEARRLVADLVAQLEEPYRSTVLLCYGQGLSPSDVASKQAIPAGTVRWRLKRGLDDLRASLDARYRGDRGAWAIALAPLAAQAVPLPASATAAVGMKLALAAAATAAAAMGLALGTWSSPRRAPPAAATAPLFTAVAPSAAPAPSVARGAGASFPSAPAGGGGPPARGPDCALAAAAAPAAAGVDRRPGDPAPGPSEEVIRRVMQVGNAPSKGNPKAPVTIVAWSEFQCPFCARVQPTLVELMGAFPRDVRLVWKNLPLAFHEHAKLAAEAALAAGEQGKFWEMHDRLFQNQTALEPASLELHAQAIGLDLPRFRRALEEKRFLPAVEEDMKLAKEAGINGTPTFYINGHALAGAQPLSAFKTAVEDELARAKGLPVPERPTGSQTPPPPPSPEALARAAEPGNAPSLGDPRAPVTIVLFADFQCPFSKRAVPTWKELLAAYPKELRLVWKNRPLPFHEQAALAAEAAMAAHEQGKFWPMYERLFANQQALAPAALEEHAKAVGLDLVRYRAAIEQRTFRPLVEADAKAAAAAGILGTPTALVNGRPMSGARPLEFWKGAVDRALLRARGLPAPDEPAFGPPAGPGGGGGIRTRPDVQPRDWPPPAVALPDELLGEKLRVRFPTGDAPSIGSGRAPVEVLYFNDYDCMGCGRGKTWVDGLRATYGKHLRLVARPVPMQLPGNENAQLVAEAAWSAHAQGKFWEMHDKLFSLDQPRNRATLEKYAGEIGLDVEDFRAALDSGRYQSKVAEDVELLKQAGLRGRPLFVINGRRADGPAALVPLVEGALRKAGIKPPPLPERPRATGPGADPYVLTTPQRFHTEARDEKWASDVVGQIGPLIERDLRAASPDVAGVRLECGSNVCRVLFRSPKSRAAAAALLRQVYGAEVPGGGSEAYLRVRSERDRSTADADVARVRSRRSGVLFALRTGRTTDPDLPVSRLPAD